MTMKPATRKADAVRACRRATSEWEGGILQACAGSGFRRRRLCPGQHLLPEGLAFLRCKVGVALKDLALIEHQGKGADALTQGMHFRVPGPEAIAAGMRFPSVANHTGVIEHKQRGTEFGNNQRVCGGPGVEGGGGRGGNGTARIHVGKSAVFAWPWTISQDRTTGEQEHSGAGHQHCRFHASTVAPHRVGALIEKYRGAIEPINGQTKGNICR